MTSFNDGIEAALTVLRDGQRNGYLSMGRAIMTIEALKRPEPSEEERVEKVARALAKLRAVNDPDKTIKMNGLNKPWWRVFEEDARAALAALKAMEGE